MSKGERLFRGPESHAAEKLSRDALAPFLNDRDYVVIDDERKRTGVATQQFISLRTPDGQVLSMRVRLCWRRDGRNPNEKKYAAAQLAAHLRQGGWDDDTYDDCPAPGYSTLGRDEGKRVPVLRSEVRRDPHVRRAVLERAGFACEREDCGKRRDFPGFLDVHHILGAEKSDRVYNCVALCPCCHREAHYAPDAIELNKQLLTYAKRFG